MNTNYNLPSPNELGPIVAAIIMLGFLLLGAIGCGEVELVNLKGGVILNDSTVIVNGDTIYPYPTQRLDYRLSFLRNGDTIK